MADASYVQASFSGGEWSKSMQGRVDRPDYRTALNVCLNGMAIEQGAWQRRSGTQFCGTARNGLPGRVIAFDFEQAAPYNVEFTDGFVRAWAGPQIVSTNDDQVIVAISTANPAVVQTTSATTWSTADQAIFKLLGASCPLLQNRVFSLTKIDTTHFSLTDPLTGATIDGSTLGVGSLTAGAKISRILQIASPYVGGNWADVRMVQADLPTAQGTTPGAVLLNPTIAPYTFEVLTLPGTGTYATFSLAPSVFKDGPYLDPVPGGTLLTPSAKSGNITCTLSFNAYDATRSYTVGDYVTSSSVNYKSLTDANLNNTPVSSPTNWKAVTASDAIGPNGFQGSDVGRFVRIQSAPPLWAAGTPYTAGQNVAYGSPETFWVCINASGSTGNIPGADLTNWAIATNSQLWTWGKITGLSNIISGTLSGSVNIGSMSSGGGNGAAFDGLLSKPAASCAAANFSGVVNPGDVLAFSSYVGKNYSSPGAETIGQGIVYPSNDTGFWTGTITDRIRGPTSFQFNSVTLNLRGKSTAPASSSDGTLLGTSGPVANTTGLIVTPSSNQSTAYNYVWFEVVVSATAPSFVSTGSSYTASNAIAQVTLFNPPGTGVSQGFVLQILGAPLLYTSAIRTWRLGLFSATTGWPTCGTYHEGRLWLSGVIGNRIDGSVSNDIFNFAPTNQDGSVADNNAIAYKFDAADVNPIFWMTPDQQGIACGTQPAEWLVQATTANAILTPTSIQAHRVTRNGCANIEPRRTDHTIVVVQRYGRKILEYFADVFSGKFSAQDIIEKDKPVTKAFIQEIAYQQELTPLVWARMGDGSLVSVTYRRDSLMSSQEAKMAAAARHTLGSGRQVQSITVGPSPDGNLDSLAMVTNDPGTNIHHVEIMANLWEEGNALGSAWMLDDAVVPTSTSTTNTATAGAPYGGMTLNGLWHLNGKTVQVFAGGLDCGDRGDNSTTFTDFVVTNGSVFVPYGDGVSSGPGRGLFTPGLAAAAAAAGHIVAGFTYTSQGQVVPPNSPAESGARNGPAFGKIQRHHAYAIKVYDTSGMWIGTDFTKLYPVLFKNVAGIALGAGATFTGTYWDQISDGDSRGSMICWQSTRPLPANLAELGGFLHTSDQ